MQVIIAEKPSVAREIAAIVGATNRKDGFIEGNGYGGSPRQKNRIWSCKASDFLRKPGAFCFVFS